MINSTLESHNVNVIGLASIATTVLAVGTTVIALALPVPGNPQGPTGSDCRLMAQALAESYFAATVVASDRVCAWRQLGHPRAVDINSLPSYDGSNFVGFKSADELHYSLWGTRAEVVVGSQVAELYGLGERCTYYRLFGRWHRLGCETAWIS